MNKNLIRLTQLGLLAAISVVLVYLIHFPLIPAAPYLEYDMADVPVLLAALLYGPVAGLAVLAIVSVVQAFLLGGSGWVGCIMHFVASGAMVLLVGLMYGKAHNVKRAAIGMMLGVLAVVLLMIPLNMTLTVYFNGVPAAAVRDMILPVLIPFNLIKPAINCVLTMILFRTLSPFVRRHQPLFGL